MQVQDWIVIGVLAAIFGTCLAVDLWVRSREDELDRAARRRIQRELARREEEECRD